MSSRKEAILAAALPVLPILIPLGVHFVLVSFVFLFAVWLPAYSFVHLILFLVGLWACHDKTSVIAAIALVVVIVFSGLVDIIQLGLYFPSLEAATSSNPVFSQQDRHTWQFSAAMSIFNLLFKPVSAALVCVGVYFRSGGRLPGVLGRGAAGGDSYNTIHGSDETNE